MARVTGKTSGAKPDEYSPLVVTISSTHAYQSGRAKFIARPAQEKTMGKFYNFGKFSFIAFAIIFTTIAVTCYFGAEYLAPIFIGSVIGALPALLVVLLTKSSKRHT
ncbi:MAG: hypothetical protein IPP57_28420 [Candidatus Obscuribacter sp.]|nr:hypothetical protein [Candidatus Obscuribacter sp.]